MKSKEEIEDIANKEYGEYSGYHKASFTSGYIKCQEDMVDKKYTEQDIINAIQYGIDIEAGNIKFDYKKYPNSFTQYIQSLNKQNK